MKRKTTQPRWRDILLFLELWLLSMVLSNSYFCLIEQVPVLHLYNQWQELVIDGISMMVFVGLSLVLNRIFIRLFQPLQHYLGKMMVYSVLLLLVNTFVATLYSSIWDLPHQEYTKSIYIFSLIATFISGIHANILFQKAYRRQTEARHELEMENARQKEINLQTSLMALKSQVDPHFLFNNFSILSELIDENPEDAHAFLDCLSKVYRYKLMNMNKDLVSIQEELQMLRSYVELVQTRFGNAIQVVFPDDGPSAKRLPPLALQLLVENAVKHNAHTQKKPLVIHIEIGKDSVVVSNELQPLSSKVVSTGLGLKNLRERYELLADKNIEVENNGKQFKVTIPIL